MKRPVIWIERTCFFTLPITALVISYNAVCLYTFSYLFNALPKTALAISYNAVSLYAFSYLFNALPITIEKPK